MRIKRIEELGVVLTLAGLALWVVMGVSPR